jgi:hypothetical protein
VLGTPSAVALDEAITSAKRQLVQRFYTKPDDFFTEADLTAFLAHCLHLELEKAGVERSLVHLEYPTPFRCDMRGGEFELIDETSPAAKRHRRGAFDLAVMNPAFIEEFAARPDVLKGQSWAELRDVLSERTKTSEPVALALFELMYNRKTFWTNTSQRRGQRTMEGFVAMVEQDLKKLQAACVLAGGFQFARCTEMLVFDSELAADAARKLRSLVPAEVEVYSSSLPPSGLTR